MPEPREDDENSAAEIDTDYSDGEEGQKPDKQNKLNPPTQGMNLGFSKLFDEPRKLPKLTPIFITTRSD
jgi:hypothetical protein